MTEDQTLELHVRLPWTIVPSTSEDTGARMLRIEELPEFLVVEEPGRDATHDFWSALRGLLQSYLEAGDAIPLPKGSDPQALARLFQPDPWVRTSDAATAVTARPAVVTASEVAIA